MRASIRKMGNSSGVIIPKPMLASIGAKSGDLVDLAVEDGRLIMAPIARKPREGWAADAKRIAEAGDDALVWPEFHHEEDEKLEW